MCNPVCVRLKGKRKFAESFQGIRNKMTEEFNFQFFLDALLFSANEGYDHFQPLCHNKHTEQATGQADV